MTNREAGFTLLELLITMSIIMLVTLISGPILIKSFEAHAEKHFFTLFEYDVFLIQNDKFRKDNSSRIILRDDHYLIVTESIQTKSVERHFLDNMSIVNNNIRFIRFNYKGTVVNPTTLIVKKGSDLVEIVFPFGKGRFYVKE